MMKRILSMLLTIFLLLGLDASAMAAENDTHFTWVIDKSVESFYYDDYAKGPVQQWWMNQEWDADGDGVGKTIDVEFWPLTEGSERDRLNTLFGTGDYADIMSMNYSTDTAAVMYEEGIALDLTEYVEKYMPNYLAWLEENPEYKNRLTVDVDGESKYLMLYNVTDIAEPIWEGWCYRRDWIAKYGTNPETGAAFTGGWNDGVWTDDIVFPSGGTDPVYISDWEWMLQIFQKALESEGITDGYALQLFYTGFTGSGDLVSSFGGGAPLFSIDKEGKAQFFGNTDNFRTYIECLSDWFSKGYIDPAFQERSSDQMFFMVDSASVYSGKVGMFIGMQAQLEDRMYNENIPWTNGICVYGAAQPINDVYGGDAQKNVAPDTFYANSRVLTGIIITDKAKNKDIPTLLTAIDFMYSHEGGMIRSWGFGSDHLDLAQNEFYARYGIDEDGAYTVFTNEDGEEAYLLNDKRNNETNLEIALAANRITGMITNKNVDRGYSIINAHSVAQWSKYPESGTIGAEITAQLNSDQAGENSAIQNNVYTYMAQEVPAFITGVRDIHDDSDWADYCDTLDAFDPQTYADNINSVLGN